jgi:hypothetical protein
VARLSEARLSELLGILCPQARALEAAGTIPYPNAVGVPPLGTE